MAWSQTVHSIIEMVAVHFVCSFCAYIGDTQSPASCESSISISTGLENNGIGGGWAPMALTRTASCVFLGSVCWKHRSKYSWLSVTRPTSLCCHRQRRALWSSANSIWDTASWDWPPCCDCRIPSEWSEIWGIWGRSHSPASAHKIGAWRAVPCFWSASIAGSFWFWFCSWRIYWKRYSAEMRPDCSGCRLPPLIWHTECSAFDKLLLWASGDDALAVEHGALS